MKVIEIRKLAAADMDWAGVRLITAEYVLGIALPLALGALALRSGLALEPPLNWQTVFGAWLVGIAANYVPLTFHAVDLLRRGRVRAEGRPERAHPRRYGTQQIMLLVPLLVFVLAIVQERRRRRRPLDAAVE